MRSLLECTLIFLVFSLNMKIVWSVIECRNTEKCICDQVYKDIYVFNCPKNYQSVGGAKITVNNYIHKGIQINCKGHLSAQDFIAKIPTIQIEPQAGNNVDIRFCPLPKTNFIEILEHFYKINPKELIFISSFNESLILNKGYFVRLGKLESLKLLLKENFNFDNDNLLEMIPNLRSFTLEKVGDLRFGENLFKHAPTLTLITIKSDRLVEIPKGLFNGLKNLREINLEKNDLMHLPPNLFKGDEKLKIVNMGANSRLQSLPDYLFSNLSSLQKVKLDNCGVISMPEYMFTGNYYMQKHLRHKFFFLNN